MLKVDYQVVQRFLYSMPCQVCTHIYKQRQYQEFCSSDYKILLDFFFRFLRDMGCPFVQLLVFLFSAVLAPGFISSPTTYVGDMTVSVQQVVDRYSIHYFWNNNLITGIKSSEFSLVSNDSLSLWVFPQEIPRAQYYMWVCRLKKKQFGEPVLGC